MVEHAWECAQCEEALRLVSRKAFFKVKLTTCFSSMPEQNFLYLVIKDLLMYAW